MADIPGMHARWPARLPVAETTALTVLMVIMGVAIAVHVAVLLPVVDSEPGRHPLLDAGSDFLGAACVAVMLWLRGRLDAGDGRRMWRLLSVGVALYVTGSLASMAVTVGAVGGWGTIAAYAGWLSLYALCYAAMIDLVRRRIPRFHASMPLDGVVAALAVAAFAVAFLLDPVIEATADGAEQLTRALIFPVADLLLIVLFAGILTVINRGVSRSEWALAAGLFAFAVTNVVYGLQMARGTYVDGGPLDLGWVLAHTCLAVAACLPTRPPGERAPLAGLALLTVPGVAATGAVLLLLYGTWEPVPPLADRLALFAVAAALARTALSFRELRALADTRREARTDELTGLPNRRRFYEALTADPAPAGRSGGAVLLIDLDRFKEINDSLGHHAGDHLLSLIGPRLAPALGPHDLLARLGGDEFAILSPGLDGTRALALGAQLRRRLQRPFAVGALDLTIDASIGVSLAPSQAAFGTELLQLADVAMYAAKQRRAGVLLFDETRDGQSRHRIETVEELRHGLTRGELVLHYQPKLDLRSARVCGAEALVRWAHPTRGLLYPDAFIELAESSGLMCELTPAVVDVALAQARRWADAGLELTVAVNVSPSNLVDERFPDRVEGLLVQHELPASALMLEVTESLLMEDRERAVAVLSRLRATGVGVAIDDYGTGYSSLAYLADLPICELKLDRAFVAAMSVSPRNQAIVTSTIELAHALDLVMVAEGVEDRETLDKLAEHGCDLAQGYFVGRPTPADALTEKLLEGAVTAHLPSPSRFVATPAPG